MNALNTASLVRPHVALTTQSPDSSLIDATQAPRLIFGRGFGQTEQSVTLFYVTGHTCEPYIRTPVRACGCLFALNKDNSYIVTPFPGVFQLHYEQGSNGGKGIEIIATEQPYHYNPRMLVPACCGISDCS